MAGPKVKLKDTINRVVRLGSDGSGATVGKDLRWPDGTVVKASDIRNPTSDTGSTGGLAATVWKLIREIPANIQKLAKLAGIGFTTRGADGERYQRSIAQGEGIAVTNGDGIADDPTIALAELPDTGGGTLQKTSRDGYGRLTGTSDATTDDLDEGAAHLWYTDARAAAAAPVQSVNGKTGAVGINASDVGADPAGAASSAIAAHVAAADPHPQYTTAAEAAAAAPVQSVNAKTGTVVLAPSDIGLAGGTTGQFWRGDGTWSNELLSNLTIRSALVGVALRPATTAPPAAQRSIGGIDAFSGNGTDDALGGTINFRASRLWTATDNGSDCAIRLIKNGTTTLTEFWRIRGDGAMVPGADNAQACGDGSLRWSVVFAASGTINTSDAREKTPVRPFTPAELAAAVELGGEIGMYQWLAMIESKGAAARQHIGMTVQRAIEIMQKHGLDPFAYGFICFDRWDELPEIRGDDGEIVQECRPAGDRYSFRMDELLAFIARGMAHRLDAIEERLGLAGL